MKRLSIIIGITVTLTGCSFFQPVESPKPSPSPQVDLNEVLKAAISKTLHISSGSLDSTFDITFQSAPQMSDRFTAQVKGNWVGTEKKSLLETTLNFDLKNSNEETIPTHGLAKLTMATDNNKHMLRLNNINLTGEESEPVSQALQAIIGEWYLVPPGSLYPFDLLSSFVSDKQGTKQDLVEHSKYLQILDASLVQMNEEQAHHLVVTLDREGTKSLLRKLQTNDPQNISAEQLKDWENIVDNATFQGDIFIGKDSGFIHKIQGELTIVGSKNNGQQITLALDISLQNINEHVPVAIPRAEKTIDLLKLFNAPAGDEQ